MNALRSLRSRKGARYLALATVVARIRGDSRRAEEYALRLMEEVDRERAVDMLAKAGAAAHSLRQWLPHSDVEAVLASAQSALRKEGGQWLAEGYGLRAEPFFKLAAL